MKKLLLSISFISSITNINAQCDFYTQWAYCNDSVGGFYLSSCVDNVNNYTFSWSSCGKHHMILWQHRGTYIVTITDTVSHTSYIDTLLMWHETWTLNIQVIFNNEIDFDAYISGINSSFNFPTCGPFYPDTTSYCVIWQDSIPIDTMPVSAWDPGTYPWLGASAGHCYDISVYDKICNCFYATWMNTPSGTYCYPAVGVKELTKKIFLEISPNPFHATATLEIKNEELKIKNLELKIYDVMGRLVREQQIVNRNSEIINRNGLSDGLYFYQLRTTDSPNKSWQAELIATGKFVVN